jgi:hypothetical protein
MPDLPMLLVVATGAMVPVDATASRFVIGRSATASLALVDDTVARKHTVIELRDGAHYVVDMASANGTCHNGTSYVREARLSNGDEIRVGSAILLYFEGPEAKQQCAMAHAQARRIDHVTGLLKAAPDGGARVRVVDYERHVALEGSIAVDIAMGEVGRGLHARLQPGDAAARVAPDLFVFAPAVRAPALARDAQEAAQTVKLRFVVVA